MAQPPARLRHDQQEEREVLLCPTFPRSKWTVIYLDLSGLYSSVRKIIVRHVLGAGLVAQLLKDLPGMQVTWVRFLGWEDPLEKEVAPHSSILAWRIPWTEEPGRLLSMGLQESDTT